MNNGNQNINNSNQGSLLNANNRNYPLFGIAISGILLTTVYTAVLASQLMATKNKVNYLYYNEKFRNK
ncbi:hypothetical protein [Alkalibacillus haloalkaliphilus]|uniref:Uncharacterized protein n=1 Tax=Alkalibacillus haloalkaliphilus TaxID=94136 RepID=A0A511W412_9BACI|nr:hypothetical protein [Alkalibacillus haloalkaliphilus]GEN45834.1 hypothetical protein AHA02nite_16100 [Alkalibacillus haloalkaliphilus]